MKNFIKLIKDAKLTNYWHAEIIFIVPFMIWFILRVEEIVRILKTL